MSVPCDKREVAVGPVSRPSSAPCAEPGERAHQAISKRPPYHLRRPFFLDPRAPAVHEKCHDRANQEYYKQDLCDSRS
jgi:hypothetical protein